MKIKIILILSFFFWLNIGYSQAVEPNQSGFRSIKVLAPNGGEVLYQGENYGITWTAEGFSAAEVYIAIYKGNKCSFNPSYKTTICGNLQQLDLIEGIKGGKVPNTGYFNWKVHEGLPVGDDYRVTIQAVDGSALDQSDQPFKIVSNLVQPEGVDIKLKGVIKDPNLLYGFFLNICINGDYSINDLKQFNRNIKDPEFAYKLIQNLKVLYYPPGKQPYEYYNPKTYVNYNYTYLDPAVNDLKGGSCLVTKVDINPKMGILYDANHEMVFWLDETNVIKETNEENNTYVFKGTSVPEENRTTTTILSSTPKPEISTTIYEKSNNISEKSFFEKILFAIKKFLGFFRL